MSARSILPLLLALIPYAAFAEGPTPRDAEPAPRAARFSCPVVPDLEISRVSILVDGMLKSRSGAT